MHWILVYFYVFDVSFVLALILTPVFKRLSVQWGCVDQPDQERKHHTYAMPSVIRTDVVSCLLTILWMITITNAMNFLDTLDGLCAGVGLGCAALFGFIAGIQHQYFVCLLAFALAGALLGFLPHNFKPAT